MPKKDFKHVTKIKKLHCDGSKINEELKKNCLKMVEGSNYDLSHL